MTEWAELMITRAAFANNLRLEADVRLSENGHGLGFLLSVPEERHSLEEGYCLWVSPDACKLFRNNVQVLEAKLLKSKFMEKISIKTMIGKNYEIEFLNCNLVSWHRRLGHPEHVFSSLYRATQEKFPDRNFKLLRESLLKNNINLIDAYTHILCKHQSRQFILIFIVTIYSSSIQYILRFKRCLFYFLIMCFFY